MEQVTQIMEHQFIDSYYGTPQKRLLILWDTLKTMACTIKIMPIPTFICGIISPQ